MTSSNIWITCLFLCLGTVGLPCCSLAGVDPFSQPVRVSDLAPDQLVQFPLYDWNPAQASNADWRYLESYATRIATVLGATLEANQDGLQVSDGVAIIAKTMMSAGAPAGSQMVGLEVQQTGPEPFFILCRATEDFGELYLEFNLQKGAVKVKSITIQRSLKNGLSPPSPQPQDQVITDVTQAGFAPVTTDWAGLGIMLMDEKVQVFLNSEKVLECIDPDPAGGLFAVGSAGAVKIRHAGQREIITDAEQARRETAWKEMQAFGEQLDAGYLDDVRKVNSVIKTPNGLVWKFQLTGASMDLNIAQGGQVRLTAGLYGNDVLLQGPFPSLMVQTATSGLYQTDPRQPLRIIQSGLTRLVLEQSLVNEASAPLEASLEIELSDTSIWFWKVAVKGLDPELIRLDFHLGETLCKNPGVKCADLPLTEVIGKCATKGGAVTRHNGHSGMVLWPAHRVGAAALDCADGIVAAASGPELHFITKLMPPKPVDPIGLKTRMVHFIRTPEGPVSAWRAGGPSAQEYPTNEELERYARHGTKAMVWHHTWLSSDFRGREGFLANQPEMERATKKAHALGMAVIGYIGIVPGRNTLLGPDDFTSPYGKNWDLVDFTFGSVQGRWLDFLPWMADYWARTYQLDGFYVDGALGLGNPAAHLDPNAKVQLNADRDSYRLNYRVKKVFERHGGKFGLECWGGTLTDLGTHYNCRMIGESFHSQKPQDYRNMHNALLAGTTFKMYGDNNEARNPYNLAMAAVNLSDIQLCSGNNAWGCLPDASADWTRIAPFWKLLDSVDYINLISAMPWWEQKLIQGDVLAGTYINLEHVLVFIANTTTQARTVEIAVQLSELPQKGKLWRVRQIYPKPGEFAPLGDGKMKLELPSVDEGPIALMMLAK